MSNLRVKGFSDIAFWQEDSIGIIVLKSDKTGNIRLNIFPELMQALALAATDEKVKYVALTGMNSNFARTLVLQNDERIESALEIGMSFALFSSGVQKPLISLINGDATNIGYEIALVSDIVISSGNSNLGFDNDYSCIMGGSIARRRFYGPSNSLAEVNKNSDIVLLDDDFLGKSKEFILNNVRQNIFMERNSFRWDIRERILEEHNFIMKRLLSNIKTNEIQKD
ncbi:MAG: enoyl-CoA hydratase-related protein [Thermoplasmataceae archaeon]